MKYRGKAAIAGVSVAIAALAGTGTAFAYWNTTGSGTGTATVATVKPLVISQVPITDLTPGKPAALVAIISNPNAFDISLAQQSPVVTPAIDSQHSKCDLSNFELTAPTIAASAVKANGSVGLVGGSVVMLDLPKVDQNACQGATLTFSYALTGSV